MKNIVESFFDHKFSSAVLLMAAGVIVYSNSFECPFIFDDSQILDSPQLHRLFPFLDIITNTNRPFLNLSLALNYAFHGIAVQGYHLVNLTIHIIASLFLLGVLRRIFQSPRLSPRYGSHGHILAFIIAFIWLVHPLQTNSVTYIIQRAESMMGMFYLGTVYGAVRYFRTPHDGWLVGAVIFCMLGMATKEVMFTAPIIIMFIDYILWSSSWGEMIKEHKTLYIALFLTWLIPVYLLLSSQEYHKSVGFGLRTATPMEYLLTQPGVIFHYLKLAIFPVSLCLDYQWPIATKGEEIFPPLFILGTAILATIWGLQGKRPPALAGLWFFLILSVTSSFIPIQDLAFEHRMYLPLVSVILLVVLTLDWLLYKYISHRSKRRILAIIVMVLTVFSLGYLTYKRNQDYRSEEVMWRDILRKRPENLRAHNDLGLALIRADKADEALFYLNRALEINPRYIVPYNNIGLLYLNQGDILRARDSFLTAIRLKPDYAEAINNLGLTYAQSGDYVSARQQYERAVQIDGRYAESYNNLGVIYLSERKLKEALVLFDQAIQLKPHYATAYNNRGIIEIYQNRFAEAEQYFRRALRLNPRYAKALNNLGVALKNQGRTNEASMYFARALELSPQYREPAENLKDIQRQSK